MGTSLNLSVNPVNIIWTGISGWRYEFQLHQIGADYLSREGIYIFCKLALNGAWDPVYVGQTHDFSGRLTKELTRHHQWPGIIRAGATHICTLHTPGYGEAKRIEIETDLRHGTRAPLNGQ